MKRIFTLLTSGAIIAYSCLLIYSCSKTSQVTQEDTVPSNLLKLAQDWHLEHTPRANLLSIKKNYVLPPNWKEAKLNLLKNGKTEIIVPSPDFNLSPNSDRGALRKFVFTVDGGQISGGYIIEMFSSAGDMAANKGNLFERFREGDMGNFTGSVITYNINYRYISGYNYKLTERPPLVVIMENI